MRYFEDFSVGEVAELGPVTVTAEEIVEFASRFDPQPFHLSEEAGKATPYDGLIASGWHTTALFMSMFVPAVLNESASLGSPASTSCAGARRCVRATRCTAARPSRP
jgi:acyl dehydratase